MRIKNVYLMNNGMVAVFNEKNEQVPELQGVIFEVMKKIGEAADKYTEFYFNSPVKSNIRGYFQKRDRK